jgi:non-ribosomal peptide synthetase component F
VNDERLRSGSPEFRQAAAYWKQKLAEPVIPLTFYGRNDVKQTTQVKRIRCDLGVERTQRLQSLAEREGVMVRSKQATLFNIFATVLATYLHRVSGQTRLSLGAPFHNRLSESYKQTIGLFMEVLPLRFEIGRDETFQTLLQKIAAEVRASLSYRQYAIANPQYSKAYDVLINYHTAGFASFNGAQVTTDWIHSGHENDSFALQVYDFGLTGSLVLDFDLRCDVFNEEQRGRVVDHFFRVVDAMLEDVGQPISLVEVLGAEEENRILRDFNRTEEPAGTPRCIHQTFEEQTDLTPHQLAVVADDQSLT